MFLGNIPDIFLSTEKPPAMLKGWSPISWVIPPSGGNSRIFLSDVELLLCKEKKNGWAPKREAFQVVNGHCSTTCRTRKKKHLADKEVACLTTNLENSNDYLFTTTFQKRWGKTLTTRVVGLQYLVSSGRL